MARLLEKAVEPRNITVSARVTETLAEELKTIAEAEGLTLSDVIVTLLELSLSTQSHSVMTQCKDKSNANEKTPQDEGQQDS